MSNVRKCQENKTLTHVATDGMHDIESFPSTFASWTLDVVSESSITGDLFLLHQKLDQIVPATLQVFRGSFVPEKCSKFG